MAYSRKAQLLARNYLLTAKGSTAGSGAWRRLCEQVGEAADANTAIAEQIRNGAPQHQTRKEENPDGSWEVLARRLHDVRMCFEKLRAQYPALIGVTFEGAGCARLVFAEGSAYEYEDALKLPSEFQELLDLCVFSKWMPPLVAEGHALPPHTDGVASLPVAPAGKVQVPDGWQPVFDKGLFPGTVVLSGLRDNTRTTPRPKEYYTEAQAHQVLAMLLEQQGELAAAIRNVRTVIKAFGLL